DVIPKGIKDIYKIKNSIIKNNKKISYKEYIASKLVKVHKIEKLKIIKILKISNNEKTYVNALRNLKLAIETYKEKYKIEDISNHFIKEFKNKYSKKIWMMNGKTDKVNDFNEIWETRFKKALLNKSLKESYHNKYLKDKKNITNYDKRIRVIFDNHKGLKKISKIKIN
ncbi:plasmid maintenance protein, partial [Borreliella garinii]